MICLQQEEIDHAGTFNQFVNLKSRFVVSFGCRVFLKDWRVIMGAL